MEQPTAPIVTRCATEFVGTFFLVLIMGCSVLSGNWVIGPASTACALTALTCTTSDVSGGHLNPAVTLAVSIAGRMPGGVAVVYVVSQLSAALMAAFTYNALYSQSFALGPLSDFGMPEAGLVELIYTFMLCLVFLNCDAQREGGAQFLGAAVGLVLVASGIAAGTVSGGCLNPAAALAVDAAGRDLRYGLSFYYSAYQLAGAAVAGVLFKVMRPEHPPGGGAAGGRVPAILAEAAGTFLLALTATLGAFSRVWIDAWATAAALSALVFALGDISGAHLNPAVSLAVAACGNAKGRFSQAGTSRRCVLRVHEAVATQLVSAALAGVVALHLHGWRVLPLRPRRPYHWLQQSTAEAAFACLLVFAVLAVTSDRARESLTQYAGLAIGSCMLAGGHVVNEVANGTMNPALTASLGIAGAYNLGDGLHLVGSELVGAAFAGALLQLTHPLIPLGEGRPLLSRTSSKV